jgi:XTP/dITP diphosphohydrolase
MMTGPRVLLATTNPGKVREFARLLGDMAVRWVSLADLPGAPEVQEDGATYAENALHKATALAAWSGMVTLADDSGLEVDALEGAPGVQSARYAGLPQDPAANTAKLLAALDGVPPGLRAARFRCVLALVAPDGATLVVDGCCEGVILDAPRGRGGFGYDPVFLFPATGRTFAELSGDEKDRVSHRAQACAALRPLLPAFVAAHCGEG